jgi:hypothetical protein
MTMPNPAVRLLRLSGLGVLLVAAAFPQIAGPRAAAAAGAEVSVDVPADPAVALGETLPVGLTISNASDVGVSGSVSVRLTRLATATSKEIRQIDYVLDPGASREDELAVTTGQWFRHTGRYRVMVILDASVVDRFTVTVKESPVLVPRFRDVTEDVGIDSEIPHEGFCAGGSYLAGAAWGDVEGDGDLDLYIPRQTGRSHLWVNRGGRFSERGKARGVADEGSIGIGAAFADYDNDGDSDLYVVNQGTNRLYRNDGSGNFTDVAVTAGVDSDTPDASAAWGDFDNDGFLDLYVANWGTRCKGTGGAPEWTYYPDKLYRNNGDGTFTDHAEWLAREGSTMGAGLQAAWLDYDDDSDLDLYLGNDYIGPGKEPNFLWRNDGSGADGEWVFTDVSDASGAGVPIHSMGIGVGDYDRDLDLDVAVSDIGPLAFLRNEGDGTFSQQEAELGLDREWQGPGARVIGWGLDFRDLNNDGWEDLYMAAGELDRPSYQPNMLFTSRRGRHFLDHSVPSGLADTGTSRGVAFADYDRDGRVDLLVLNHDGKARLYRNVTPKRYHWLEIDLVGSDGDRFGCGASVSVELGSAALRRDVFCGSTSAASGNDPVLHFGLGRASRVSRLTVEWPSGRTQTRSELAADRLIRISEPEN